MQERTSPTGRLAAAAFFALAVSLYALPHLFPARIGTGYVAVHLALSALCGLIWWRGWLSARHAAWLGIAVILCLIPAGALTSNDMERYLWDGAVAASGLDPYRIAPDSPEAAGLRALWPTPEEHARYATLYPPGALGLFATASLAGPGWGPWAWKIMAALAGVACILLGRSVLEKRGRSRDLPLLALNPVLLLETGAGAHLDTICALAVIAVFALWDRGQNARAGAWAGIVIGLAATVKVLPAVIAGPLLFARDRQAALRIFAASASTWGVVYAAAFAFGLQPLGLLPEFFSSWRGGAPLYPVLETAASSLSLSAPAFMLALAGLAVCGFGQSAGLAIRGHIVVAVSVALAVPLLLSPVMFPWYLTVFVPLFALRPNFTLGSALLCAPLAHVVLDKWLFERVWEPAGWTTAVLGGAIVIGLVIDIARRRTPALLSPSRNQAGSGRTI